MNGAYIDIVFDGLPGPEGPRFVEVENDEGASINAGEWIEREDGFAALRIDYVTHNNALMLGVGSAIAHLLEYIDTGEGADLAAAMSAINTDEELMRFAESYPVLLPVRRDGKRQHDRMTEVL